MKKSIVRVLKAALPPSVVRGVLVGSSRTMVQRAKRAYAASVRGKPYGANRREAVVQMPKQLPRRGPVTKGGSYESAVSLRRRRQQRKIERERHG